MKAGIFKEMWMEYRCPHCECKNMISKDVWERTDSRRCTVCNKNFGFEEPEEEE